MSLHRAQRGSDCHGSAGPFRLSLSNSPEPLRERLPCPGKGQRGPQGLDGGDQVMAPRPSRTGVHGPPVLGTHWPPAVSGDLSRHGHPQQADKIHFR